MSVQVNSSANMASAMRATAATLDGHSLLPWIVRKRDDRDGCDDLCDGGKNIVTVVTAVTEKKVFCSEILFKLSAKSYLLNA